MAQLQGRIRGNLQGRTSNLGHQEASTHTWSRRSFWAEPWKLYSGRTSELPRCGCGDHGTASRKNLREVLLCRTRPVGYHGLPRDRYMVNMELSRGRAWIAHRVELRAWATKGQVWRSLRSFRAEPGMLHSVELRTQANKGEAIMATMAQLRVDPGRSSNSVYASITTRVEARNRPPRSRNEGHGAGLGQNLKVLLGRTSNLGYQTERCGERSWRSLSTG